MRGGVLQARFDSTAARIYTVGRDGIRTWNVAPTNVTFLRGMSGDVAAQFIPGNPEIVASDFDTTWLFDSSGAVQKRLTGHVPNEGVKAAVSPDGRSLASVANDERVILYTRADGWRGRRLRFAGHGNAIGVRFSADGLRLVAIFDQRTDIYAIPSGNRIGSMAGWPASYSSDLSEGISTLADKPTVIDIPSGKLRRRLPGARPVALSPDGKLAATTIATDVHVLDVASGRERYVLTTPANVRALTFSADGTRLLTTQSDGSVGLWSAADGHPDALLVSHEGPASVAAFNADASLVAVGGSGWISLFDAATGVALERFGTGGDDELSSLTFGGARDDLILAGHVQSGRATLVECPICRRLPELVRLAEGRVTRGFTAVERRRFLHER